MFAEQPIGGTNDGLVRNPSMDFGRRSQTPRWSQGSISNCFLSNYDLEAIHGSDFFGTK